jgi:hypothetical protein
MSFTMFPLTLCAAGIEECDFGVALHYSLLPPCKILGLLQEGSGHQSFWEASSLSKSAVTQQTPVQKLSPENKRGFPYVPFRAGYRNGGKGLHVVPYIITLFHWLF